MARVIEIVKAHLEANGFQVRHQAELVERRNIEEEEAAAARAQELAAQSAVSHGALIDAVKARIRDLAAEAAL